jgi:hypothetical protein
MKIKTNDLKDLALDWAVHQAWCEGACHDEPFPSYSTNWAPSGPIIEREFIELNVMAAGHTSASVTFDTWLASTARHDEDMVEASGPTPLIAAMRCFVASKLGDEVEIPEELT